MKKETLIFLFLLVIISFRGFAVGKYDLHSNVSSTAPQIIISPKSSSDELVLKLKNMPAEQYTLQIFDREGKTVTTQKLSSAVTSSLRMYVDIHELVTGIYFFSFVNSKGSVLEVGKFVKSEKSVLFAKPPPIVGMVNATDENGMKFKAMGDGFSVAARLKNLMVPVVLCDIYGSEIYSLVIVKTSIGVVTGFDLAGKLSPGVYFVIGSSMNGIFGRKMVIL